MYVSLNPSVYQSVVFVFLIRYEEVSDFGDMIHRLLNELEDKSEEHDHLI